MTEQRRNLDTTKEPQDEYLNLLDEVRVSKEEILDDKKKLNELIETSNELFKRIKTSSELKLDAKFNAMTLKLAHLRMDRDFNVNSLTLKKFLKIINDDNINEFVSYGIKCSQGISFSDNLVLKCKKEDRPIRSQQVRNRLIISKTEIPKSLSVNEEINTQNKIAENLEDILKNNERYEYTKLVIDCESFTKTIENMFYLSAAVRNRMCSITKIDGILYIIPFNEITENEKGHGAIDMSYDKYISILEKMKTNNRC